MKTRLPTPNAPSPRIVGPERGSNRGHWHSRRARSFRSILWARNISSIDQRLGAYIDNVRALLRIQTLVLERQDWARRVLEASLGSGSVDYPHHVLNPIGSFQVLRAGCAENQEGES